MPQIAKVQRLVSNISILKTKDNVFMSDFRRNVRSTRIRSFKCHIDVEDAVSSDTVLNVEDGFSSDSNL